MRQRLGARCDVLGYLLTMYDRREKITAEVEKILRRNFGAAVFADPIRVNTRHKAAPSHKKTIFEFEAKSGKGRSDYEKLVDGVLARLDERSRSAERLPQVVDDVASVLDSHR
jgi:chromosome partitioning protein